MKNNHSKNRFFSGLGRNVAVLGLVSFFNDVSSEMIYPILPLFLTITLGASAELLGLIEGIAESTAATLKLFSGWLSDKLQRRKSIAVSGYSLSALSRPLMAMAMVGWHVLLIRFTDRVGKGIRTAPRDALIADSTEPEFRGKAFGFHRAMDHAGAVVGPLIAMAVLAFAPNNYRLVFWLAVIPALFSVSILILGTKEIPPERTAPVPSLSLRGFDRNFRYYLFVIILFTLGNSSDAFLLLRANQLGIPGALIPVLWMILHAVKFVSSMPGGSLSDKIGRKRVIITGWIIYALVYAAFAFSSESWQIWALFTVYGLFFGLTEGAERAFVTDLVNPELRGTAYGVFNFAIGIGALPASVIMGVLWHRFNPSIAFLFGATMAVGASLLLIAVREERGEKKC
ncbi:MAG: MFS transporter [Pseudomonadota bacterium]